MSQSPHTVTAENALFGLSVLIATVREGFQHSLDSGRYMGTYLEPFLGQLQVVLLSLAESGSLCRHLSEEITNEQMRGFGITIAPLNKDGGSPLSSR